MLANRVKPLSTGALASRVKAPSMAALVAHARTPLYRNAYALTLSSGVTSALGVAYWILAAHYYTTSVVGLNTVAISTMMFLSGVSQLNLMGMLIRFIPCAGQVTRRLVSYTYLATVVAAAVVSLIFMLGLDLWVPRLSFLRTSLPLILWFTCATMGWCIFALQDNVLTGLRQTIWVPIENALFGVVKIALLIVFARSWPQYGIFASWTIPVALAIVPVNLLIFRRLIPAHVRTTVDHASPLSLSSILRYVASDYLGYLFSLASSTLLPIMVTSLVGVTANAHFYLSWIIASSLYLVTMNMMISFTVEGARAQWARHELQQGAIGATYYHVLVHTGRLLVPLVAGVVLGAPYLLHIFGSDYATNGTALLRLLALAALPNMVNALYLSVSRVQRRMARVVLMQGALSLLTLTLSYTLLRGYGLTGLGVAWLVSQTSVAVVVLAIALRPLAHAAMPRRSRSAG